MGDRLRVKLIEVTTGCACEELGSAHAEVTCALRCLIEDVIGDRDSCLHGSSITRYDRAVAESRSPIKCVPALRDRLFAMTGSRWVKPNQLGQVIKPGMGRSPGLRLVGLGRASPTEGGNAGDVDPDFGKTVVLCPTSAVPLRCRSRSIPSDWSVGASVRPGTGSRSVSTSTTVRTRRRACWRWRSRTSTELRWRDAAMLVRSWRHRPSR